MAVQVQANFLWRVAAVIDVGDERGDGPLEVDAAMGREKAAAWPRQERYGYDFRLNSWEANVCCRTSLYRYYEFYRADAYYGSAPG
jgi:hypothetical protein